MMNYKAKVAKLGDPTIKPAVPVARQMTVSDIATVYGCCGLFDLCGDADLMSLSFAGSEPFLDWIGWETTSVCDIIKNFITFVRPDRVQGRGGATPTPGYVCNPCDGGNSVEWGTCDFTLHDFGRLRRHTPTRDITKTTLKLCDLQPRYRLDGTPILDDLEFDARLVTEAIIQDLKRYLITGTSLTCGLFNGLQALVRTGYVNSGGRQCRSMDSIVIDWNGNNAGGGAGMTWNGAALDPTFDLIDVLLAAARRILTRISWSSTLSTQRLQVGDIVLALPTHLGRCVLDAFTCWSVCPGVQFQEANLNTYESRKFRDALNGGLFGAGRIYLDGVEIPLINYDWGLINSPTLSDMYLLTGHVGNVRTISGQVNDMRPVAAQRPGWYDQTDGGKLLTWLESDNTCDQRFVEMQPRLLMWAPWAQARFQDVRCAPPGGPLSPDPEETSFFPEGSFSVATCPD